MPYNKLCTEFYDLLKPVAGKNEIAFYEKVFKRAKEPYLEAMSGSGRVLIPLLKRGYVIDGVDRSVHMLNSCKKRCREALVNVELFHQSVEHLSLSKKYELIFIPHASFQHIEDRQGAYNALKRFYDHLLPHGILLLETFIPWDSIQKSIHDNRLVDQKKMRPLVRRMISAQGVTITQIATKTTFAKKQLEMIDYTYEKNNEIEKERLAIRWYYRYEMELLLQTIGFKKVHVTEENFEHNNPQATVYEALK